MSALFENAVAALRMGIEDYALNDPDRSLSSVRNFYAGVLLLAKEVLVRNVPNVDPGEIIGERYKPVPTGDGSVDYIQDGQRTVDFDTLWRRFKDFGLEIERGDLKDLNAIRNEIEHRSTDKPTSVVREAIAKAFPVTLQLFRLASEDPRIALGDAWPLMLEARTLYEAERARCRQTLAKVEWLSTTVASTHLRCSECESDLIEQSEPENTQQEAMELQCLACGDRPAWDAAIVGAVDRALGMEVHIRAKDAGEDGPIYDCPGCALSAYVEDENQCAACGESVEWEEECARCYAGISLADALDGFDGGLCSYCVNLLDKDD
jgi:hypothetical protein